MGFVYVSKRNTLVLTIRVRKVEIIPEPGPISTIKVGSICLIKEYSFSSASRKRNESWSGSYLRIKKWLIECTCSSNLLELYDLERESRRARDP